MLVVFNIILFILVLVLILFVITRMVVIVRQGEVKVVESFGKYVRTIDPGLHFLIPILYNVRRKVSLKQTPIQIPPQSVITRDNVIVEIDEAIKYHVTDARAFVYDNEDSVTSMIQDCQSNLRGIIGKMELNEVLNGTEEINLSLYESVKDITAGYGLSIDRINIGEISVSDEIVNSMNKLITASRDKESLITISEGKKQSVILESEAKASEMQIDAEARAERTKIDADAEAARIAKITEAETARIKAVNQVIAESNLTDEMIAYLGIEAFKHVVENNANTVIMPSNLTEVGNVPIVKELWDKTSQQK